MDTAVLWHRPVSLQFIGQSVIAVEEDFDRIACIVKHGDPICFEVSMPRDLHEADTMSPHQGQDVFLHILAGVFVFVANLCRDHDEAIQRTRPNGFFQTPPQQNGGGLHAHAVGQNCSPKFVHYFLRGQSPGLGDRACPGKMFACGGFRRLPPAVPGSAG